MLTAGNSESLDNYIDVVAKALALPVEEAWRPAVQRTGFLQLLRYRQSATSFYNAVSSAIVFSASGLPSAAWKSGQHLGSTSRSPFSFLLHLQQL